MDIRDFQGITHLKLIVPFIHMFSLGLTFVGTLIWPWAFNWFCNFVMATMLWRVTLVMEGMIHIFFKTREIFKDYVAPPTPVADIPTLKDIAPLPKKQIINNGLFHCFVIPSYREDEDLIAETVRWIASHSQAKKKYIVRLGMEMHEPNCQEKAKRMLNRHRQAFFHMDYSIHQLRVNESKGKASNVTWSLQHLEPTLQKIGVDPNKVFLHILDADSVCPPLYIDKVEEYFDKNPGKFGKIMICPMEIFCRNHQDVPMMTHAIDNFQNCFHTSNLRSIFGVHFPFSNYSVSFSLVKSIGFLDTCDDAIGDDFHMMLKLFWKTNGKMETVPMYVPFNQTNVQTGQGMIQDMKAKIKQITRHALGVADVAYNLKQLYQRRVFSLRSIGIVCYMVDCNIATLLGWCIAIGPGYLKLLSFLGFHVQFHQSHFVNIASAIATVMFISFSLIFWSIRGMMMEKLYRKPKEGIIYFIKDFISINIVSVVIAPFVNIVAALKVFGNDRTFITSEKVIKKRV